MEKSLWRTFIILGVIQVIGVQTAVAEVRWERWRGPLQNGHSLENNLPLNWTDEDVSWKTDLPGEGQSSPIIWDDRIFLTSALERGKQRLVLALDRNSGKILWQQVAWKGDPEPIHKMNGWASATPVTDGERVYAFFGRGGLHCYTIEGKHVWTRDLGRFESPWGTAACPVIVGDLLIQNCDADEDAYIIALDKKTGKTIWKTKRPNHRGWSTPILYEDKQFRELVINGHTGMQAYDPDTGKELWYCSGLKGRGTPTVTTSEGILFTICGLTPSNIYGVKPGGKGDVSKKNRVWETRRRSGRDLPSPIIIGKFILIMNMKGILTGYDTQSGTELWTARIGGNYSATPISYAGHALFISERGETVFIKPTKSEPIITSRNRLTSGDEEIFRSSITPSLGQLFIRSTQVLYCIGSLQKTDTK